MDKANRYVILVSFLLGSLLSTLITLAVVHTSLASAAASSVVYACVAQNGNLRIVSATTTCNQNETPLQWNQQGPVGPQGPQGPAGTGGSPFGVYVCGGCNFTNGGNELDGTLLNGKDLSNAYLATACFCNILGAGPRPNVSGSKFVGADLERAYFTDADISSSDFSNAIMRGADMSMVLATSATFSGTDFSTYHDPTQPPGGNDRQTDFTNADLTGANFTGANLQGALNMSTATLSGVIWSNTTCPDGTNSDSAGNTCVGHL